jgi:hypothetical protein
MATSYSPKIITDGLVFMYDTDDGKSYKGEPTTNFMPTVYKAGSNITSGSDSVGDYFDGTITRIGCPNFTYINSGSTYTFSIEIRSNQTFNMSADSNQYAPENAGNDNNRVSVTYIKPNYTTPDEWVKYSTTVVMKSGLTNPYMFDFFIPQSFTGRMYYRNAQLEYKPHATPFIPSGTTRSATQGLIDRTGDRTIDLSNVSFDSNAEMIFDGTDDYISIPTYTFGNGSWTLNMWVNVSAFANYNLMSNSSGGPVANVFGAHGSNPKIFYMNYDGAWKDHYGNLTLTTNNWYFLTWVNYEGASASAGTMKMYVNGVADSDVFNSYITNGGPCNVIGKRWGGTSFNGKISQVSINTKSLSDPEILRNFNATKSRFGL